MEYADHLGKWTEVGARLSKQLFLNLHSLEEDIIEEVRERMESGKLKPSFRDVYYVSTAKEKSWQQAHRIEERKKETTFTRNVVTQEEYENVLAKARERLTRVETYPLSKNFTEVFHNDVNCVTRMKKTNNC